jgi:hypothetical protein
MASPAFSLSLPMPESVLQALGAKLIIGKKIKFFIVFNPYA